jgi:hypothetical protein
MHTYAHTHALTHMHTRTTEAWGWELQVVPCLFVHKELGFHVSVMRAQRKEPVTRLHKGKNATSY